MSLVTRCTSCGTLFKVVADQLKISDGWVRCGQCATVFDAQSNLVQSQEAVAPAIASNQKDAQIPVPALQAPPVAVALPPPAKVTPAESDIASEIQSFRDSKLQGSGMLGEYTSGTFPPAEKSSPKSFINPVAPAEPINAPSHSNHASLHSDEPTTFFPASVAPDSTLPHSALLDSAAAPLIVQAPLAQEFSAAAPSFVVQAQRAQRWRSPGMRLLLSFVGLILLIALAAQIALHERDRIAAQFPQTKPLLNRLCEQAGCQVQALKSIESITVDASSFNRINKNNAQLEAITQSYRLAVTLKNSGPLAVALPHVELSLQDAQDQPILRRVLSPADLGSSLTALTASQDLAGSVTLQIDTTQLAGNRIQGYRVLAFYP